MNAASTPKRRMKRKPHVTQNQVASAIAARATGMPIEAIAQATGTPKSTVFDILKREPDALADVKQHLRTRYLGIADEAADRISGHLDEVSPAQAAVIAGIMVQRGLGELSDNQAGHGGLNAAGPSLTQNNLHVHLPAGADQSNSPEILARTIALLQSGGLKRTE